MLILNDPHGPMYFVIMCVGEIKREKKREREREREREKEREGERER